MDNAVWITLWIASGAFIGGVVTPVVAANTRFNDWIAALVGTGVGAVGNVIALVPLWIVTRWRGGQDTDARLPWQRDAITPQEVARDEAARDEAAKPDVQAFVNMLAANFWPKPRTEGHSHRQTYVAVAVALAVITAIEVMLTFVDASWIVGPLVALSTLKVLLVAGFFMHLVYDSKWYAALFVIAIPFAGLILVVLALA